jgi:hypothetical protein
LHLLCLFVEESIKTRVGAWEFRGWQISTLSPESSVSRCKEPTSDDKPPGFVELEQANRLAMSHEQGSTNRLPLSAKRLTAAHEPLKVLA